MHTAARFVFGVAIAILAMAPAASAASASGGVWIIDASGPALQQIETVSGSLEARWVADLPGSAFALAATGPDEAWVLLTDQPRLLRYRSDGTLLDDVGLPTVGSSVAVDADGNAWVAFGSLDQVGRVGVSGSLNLLVDVGSIPYGLAIDADGAVWVTNAWGNSVTRIDPAGTTEEISVGFYPTGIAAHPDGSVWVVEKENVAVLHRDGSVRRLVAGASPRGVSIAPDGAVWVTNQSSSTVTRFSSLREQTEISVGLLPWGVACSSDGTTLVLCRISGEIWRLSATGEVLQVLTLPAGSYPHAFGDLSGLTQALIHKPESDFDGDGAPNRREAELNHDVFDANSTPEHFLRGDVDENGTVDLIDAWHWLHLGSAGVSCRPSADVNADGETSLGDVSALLEYLYLDGPAPSAPFPMADFGSGELTGC